MYFSLRFGVNFLDALFDFAVWLPVRRAKVRKGCNSSQDTEPSIPSIQDVRPDANDTVTIITLSDIERSAL